MANLIHIPGKNEIPASKKNSTIAKCLILAFVNISYIIGGGYLFQYLEGSPETVAKCGEFLH